MYPRGRKMGLHLSRTWVPIKEGLQAIEPPPEEGLTGSLQMWGSEQPRKENAPRRRRSQPAAMPRYQALVRRSAVGRYGLPETRRPEMKRRPYSVGSMSSAGFREAISVSRSAMISTSRDKSGSRGCHGPARTIQHSKRQRGGLRAPPSILLIFSCNSGALS